MRNNYRSVDKFMPLLLCAYVQKGASLGKNAVKSWQMPYVTRIIFLCTIVASLSQPSLADSLTNRLLGVGQQEKQQKKRPSASTPAQRDAAFNRAVVAYQNENYSVALRRFMALDAKGDPRASFNAGIMRSQGLGSKKDLAAAHRLFLRAARGGFVEGAYFAGLYYLTGIGVRRNLAEGRRLLTLAYRKQHPGAEQALVQLMLSKPYRHGIDKSTVRSLTSSLVASPNPQVLNTLGYHTLYGVATKKNPSKAYQYFTEATKTKFPVPDSYRALGFLANNGIGTTPDQAQAISYHQKAADWGSSYSITWLADNALLSGSTSAESLAHAYKLYRLAASLGSHRATVMLEELSLLLDDIQRSQGDEGAAELREAIQARVDARTEAVNAYRDASRKQQGS